MATTTPKHGLIKPEKGAKDWHIPLNNNFDKLDDIIDETLWQDYILNGIFQSSTSVSGGQRLEYTFEGDTVYRFVPEPYSYTDDRIYSDQNLTNELARRA